MSNSLYEVRQVTPVGYPEGSRPALALSRMGIPAYMSKWDLFALGGKMFSLGEGTVGTPITAQAADAGGIVLTAPAIRFTVPSGTVVFPRAIDIALQTAAGTLNELAIIANNANSYTSGGTAVTPANLLTALGAGGSVPATAVTNCYHCSGSAIIEAALTTPRHLYKGVRAAAFTAGETFHEWHVLFDDLIPIVGPASLLIYLGAAATAITFLFSMRWAELGTDPVTR